MFLQDGVNFLRHEFVYLLGCASDKLGRINHGVQFVVHGSKVAVTANAIQQIVRLSLTLDHGTSLHGMDANHFVQLLAIATCLDAW